MKNKYVVVQLSGNDLYATMWDTYEKAMYEVDNTTDKCLIVKVESVCCDGVAEEGVSVEYHT